MEGFNVQKCKYFKRWGGGGVGMRPRSRNPISFSITVAQRGIAQHGAAQHAVFTAPNPALHEGSLYFICQSH